MRKPKRAEHPTPMTHVTQDYSETQNVNEPEPNPKSAAAMRELDLSRGLSSVLENVRSESLGERVSAAHTIAELEAWREEIDATIAFLRAQRK